MSRCRTAAQKKKRRRRLNSVRKQQSSGVEKPVSPLRHEEDD